MNSISLLLHIEDRYNMKIDWDKLISCTQWLAELWVMIRVLLILALVLITVILNLWDIVVQIEDNPNP